MQCLHIIIFNNIILIMIVIYFIILSILIIYYTWNYINIVFRIKNNYKRPKVNVICQVYVL